MLATIYKKIEARQKELDSLPMRPLEICIEMRVPFSSTEEIRLDGILSYLALKDFLGDDFYCMKDKDKTLPAPLPIEKVNSGTDNWFWKCSFSKAKIEKEEIVTWKKRWDEENEDLVKKPEKREIRINHKQGFFKAYQMPIVLKSSKKLLFCCVGNEEELSKLLKKITHIGKKRSQGYGEVKSFSIVDPEKDWSLWHDYERRIASRSIPVEVKNEDLLKVGCMSRKTIRPPYWHKDNYRMVYNNKGDL